MNELPPLIPEPTRQEAILAAAFQTFCLYGFRRTTMEDIAQAAAMSRAALYLHFRNKQDIHRAIVQRYFDTILEKMRAALAAHSDPGAALSAALLQKFGPEMDAICASPHGAELMDANASNSADIIRDGEERITALLGDWLERMVATGRLIMIQPSATPPQMARTVLSALNGLKYPCAGPEALRENATRLAALFTRALRP
jgi:AcrR family transcriptional regulator